jgi:sulfur carrier protein ThiS
MRIHLEFAAVLELHGVASGQALDLAAGSTLADLLNQLKVRREHQKFVVPFVNGEQKRLSCELHEKDNAFLSVPVGGG